MIYPTIQQDIDLWEAWIEFDHVAQNFFGTLYIMGEVLVDKKETRPFIIKPLHETETGTLVLQLQTGSSIHPTRVAEVVYSESLRNIDQYSSIKIYRDNELLTQINEIEIVVS